MQIYKDIETYSEKRKFTRLMFGLVFRKTSGNPQKVSGKKKEYRKLIRNPFNSYEGKTIRHIWIETLDPFGYSISDTTAAPVNHFVNKANKFHIKSQNAATVVQKITYRHLIL